MKLDRNINSDGRGKYALLKLRRQNSPIPQAATAAATVLKEAGLLTFGNESPGEQFFVMKYKDRFTAPALRAYAAAVSKHAEETGDDSLREYASQMGAEALAAERCGESIPD